jgi:hypothetical protein
MLALQGIASVANSAEKGRTMTERQPTENATKWRRREEYSVRLEMTYA